MIGKHKGVGEGACPGRPRSVRLDAEERALVARRIATANSGRGRVSATAGARRAAEDIPHLADALARRACKHSLPEEVLEIARSVRAVVPYGRDARNLRKFGGATGHVRMHPGGHRRLRAGEQFSFDDATINVAVCVPWPVGGDRCSDRFGVRVGRFQLLLCHDDATSYVPAYVYQIREKGSYRAEDAVSLFTGVCRDVCRPDRAVFEGGVWQKGRMTAAREAMGVALVDAKGRPEQKLVENLFNRAWTQLAMELPQADLARFRGETDATTKLYLKCRAGKLDPRDHFPMLGEVLSGVDASVGRLNHEVIQSRVYGSWIPAQRWAEDMEAHPRAAVSEDEVPLWAAAPVLESRSVRGGKVAVTAPGPFGESVRYEFGSPALWDSERRTVKVAFDPQTAKELGAQILDARRDKVLCVAHCLSAAAGVGAKAAGEVSKEIREMVRREYRVLLPDGLTGQTRVARRESEVRMVGAREGGAEAPETNHPRSAVGRGAGSGGGPGRGAMDHEPRSNSGGGSLAPEAGGRGASAPAWDPAGRDRLKEIEEAEAALEAGGQIFSPGR